MEVRHLEYVVAIAEEKSFTKAAERCHTAQSALSHHIARLEAHLGVKLFDRSSRKVTVTEYGEALLPYARHVLTAISDAQCQLSELKGAARARLRLGVTQTAVRSIDLVSLLGRYSCERTNVELSLVSGSATELFACVRERKLDVAITDLGIDGTPKGLSYRALTKGEELVAVVSAHSPLPRPRRLTLSALAQATTFVDHQQSTSLRDRVDEIFRTSGVEKKVTFELGEISQMVKFAANGLGAAIVPKCFTEGPDCGFIAELNARIIEIEHPLATISVGAFTKASTSTPAIRAFFKIAEAPETTSIMA